MASIAPESTRTKSKVPDPEPQDSTEVTSCLETARELWQNGQLKEAVRWVQRGADAAEQDGNDMRALSLARTAADLAAQAASSAVTPPNGAPAVTPPNSIQAGPNSSGATPAEAKIEPAASSTKSKQPPPLPKAPTVNSLVPSPRADIEAPLSSRETLTPNPPVARETAVKVGNVSETNAPASKSAPRASTGPLRPSTSQSARPPAPARVERSPSRAPASRVEAPVAQGEVFATPEALAQWLESGAATRVSVKRSSAEPSLYVVRPLPENGKLARGARRAVLIYVDENDSSK